MNKKVIISLVLVALMGFGSAFATYAWFTSTAQSTANEFKAGTLTLNVNEKTKEAFTIALKTDNIQPGDVLTTGDGGYSTIIVKNTGTLPMATFGRFTLKGVNGSDNIELAKDIKIVDYKVEFFNAAGVQDKKDYDRVKKIFYTRTTDNFIEDGIVKIGGTASNMYNWVTGVGPQDIMTGGTPWDIEGLRKDESYKITFKLVYDENATVQGQMCNLGFEVVGTQVNAKALDSLKLENVTQTLSTTWLNYLEDQTIPVQ